MNQSVVALENKIVLYKRERSNIWQVRVKLDTGEWHRTTTKHNELKEVKERALEIRYEGRAQSKLPQSSRCLH
jgi:integrase